MQERGIIVVALLIIMVAFLSTSFSDASIVGYGVKDTSEGVVCSNNLELLNGEIVPCVNGHLDYKHSFSSRNS